jgi:hypothetical protein
MATSLDTADFFQSRFFKAENDLGEEGAERAVTIKSVDGEKVGREKELRPVLYFADSNVKPLILNKTNWSVLRNAFGPNNNWEGKQITLVAKQVDFGGESTLGTRIKLAEAKPKGKPKAKSTADDLNDEIPF